MFILKFIGLLILVGFLLGLLLLVVLFVNAKQMAEKLQRGRSSSPRADKADSGPALETRPCPYCGTFVAAPPEVDRTGTCTTCKKKVK